MPKNPDYDLLQMSILTFCPKTKGIVLPFVNSVDHLLMLTYINRLSF